MKTISSKEIYRNPVFTLTEDVVVDRAGREAKRGIVRHPGSAAVLAIDAKNRAILVRQFRVAIGARVWEIPAGKIDEGETPLKAAQRELREETGLTARKWTKLVACYPTPGYVSEKITLFLAEDLKPGEADPDEGEHLELKWFAIKDLEEEVVRGRVPDGKTLTALYAYRLLTKKRPK
ncbi:MAG: NUDIX hydrolase [Bryobacterales bacterium]|nr:NUDIX hydrolase [Bryobacterales bacterium]